MRRSCGRALWARASAFSCAFGCCESGHCGRPQPASERRWLKADLRLNYDEAFIGLERTLLQQCSSGHLGTPLHLRSKGGMPKRDIDRKTLTSRMDHKCLECSSRSAITPEQKSPPSLASLCDGHATNRPTPSKPAVLCYSLDKARPAAPPCASLESKIPSSSCPEWPAAPPDISLVLKAQFLPNSASCSALRTVAGRPRRNGLSSTGSSGAPSRSCQEKKKF